jgi:two-component system chemotaxis response regulator CheB
MYTEKEGETMSKIKVLVVDDSAFMRKVIKDLLQSDTNLEVIGTARNGQDALDQLPNLQPDLVTLDVEMPVLDGLDTLKVIVEKYQLPVIMLSSTTSVGAENTLVALERGAFDFIAKPSGSISLDLHKIQSDLIEKVKLAYDQKGKNSLSRTRIKEKRVQGVVKLEKKPSTYTRNQVIPPANSLHRRTDSGLKHLILVGTSTGGPKALQRLLSSLPQMNHAAILIVQHMPPSFTKSLANRLNQLTPHVVVEAQDGELIRGGHVYIAPGGFHMAVKSLQNKLAIHLHQEPPRGGHRPSVDVLLESVMYLTGYALITLILTGMGKDGTEGLRKITRQRKVYAIAEDESTCVVYGMPRSVVEAQLIDEIAPLDHVHLVIERLIKE